VVVTKSTVPVGTAKKVRDAIQYELDKRGISINFDVASNPEFLKEGNAIDDFLKPDRIVIGVESENAEKVLKRLYKPFVLNGHPIITMDITSAEMTKYAANAMLATKISFINDIANLCEIVGADINMVRKGIGSDPRIGSKFLYPGVGYGGSCFPKDVQALIKTASDFGYELKVLKAVEEVNQKQKSLLFNKIYNFFGGQLRGKHIAIWGLSFKPETDDMRQAPSLTIIEKLLEHGAIIAAYDPIAMNEAKRILGKKINFANDMYEALIGTDALAVITEWREFRLPNFKVMEKLMNRKVLFDGRIIFDLEQVEELGFKYLSIGRRAIEV
jgi:UDPglucose 6-dehydrogenase